RTASAPTGSVSTSSCGRDSAGCCSPAPAATSTSVGAPAPVAEDSDPEDVLQPDGDAGVLRHLADAGEDTGHEGDAVEGVVTDRQLLTLVAQEDLLVGDEPAKTDRVHRDARDAGATRAVRVLLGRVRHVPEAGVVAGGADELGGPGRRAARGVDLARVVQLDDLHRLVEARGLLRELHHQDRADREVRCDEHPDAPVGLDLGPETGGLLVRPARGTDDDVHPAPDTVPDVA